MDEKDYRESQNGYDKDTFGETGRNAGAQGQYYQNTYQQSQTQGGYNQNTYSQQTDGGSFYHSSQPYHNGFGIASMVLGILALVFFCGCINIPLAILSIIFGIILINRKTGSIGFASAGIVTSVISVILTVILIAFVSFAGTGVTSWIYADTLPFILEDYYGDDLFDDGEENGHSDDYVYHSDESDGYMVHHHGKHHG